MHLINSHPHSCSSIWQERDDTVVVLSPTMTCIVASSSPMYVALLMPHYTSWHHRKHCKSACPILIVPLCAVGVYDLNEASRANLKRQKRYDLLLESHFGSAVLASLVMDVAALEACGHQATSDKGGCAGDGTSVAVECGHQCICVNKLSHLSRSCSCLITSVFFIWTRDLVLFLGCLLNWRWDH